MSLHKYKVDFSSLNPDERANLINRIEAMSFNSLFWYSGFQSATFFIEEALNPDSLKIPNECHLTRIYQ